MKSSYAFDFESFKDAAVVRGRNERYAKEIGVSREAVRQRFNRLEDLRVRELIAICNVIQRNPQDFFTEVSDATDDTEKETRET